jgi:hypothetical protein
VTGTENSEEGAEVEVECKHMMPVSVNVLDIKPPVADLSPKIYITDKIGIVLKFPTLRSFKPITDVINSTETEKTFDMIYECADYVFDENGMYYANENPKEEFVQFLESLTQEQFDRILAFFENLPKISYDIKHTCERCGFNHNLHMEGLTDFFT